MRFLVVNGYSAYDGNHNLFDYFLQQVQHFISKQREILDTECEFFVRDRFSLQDFLYEPENSMIKVEHGLRFDNIDIVFIVASVNVKPWSSHMRNIITLIRMCMRTKKLMLATAFGAQALAYLCASNLQTHIRVTNNQGEGSKLVDFPKFTAKALQNGPNDYFLDSTTGDLYFYNKATDEWVPRSNVGIHSRKQAMEFQSIGKYIVKSPTYRPKQKQHISGEMFCSIRKQFYHHWAFKNIESEFPIPLCSTWDIHTFGFTNPEKKFTVLAENDLRGPLILESENIMCMMFEFDRKFKDTVKILQNFIDNGLKLMKTQDSYNKLSIVKDKFSNGNRGIKNIEIVFQHKERSGHNCNPEEIMKNQKKAFLIEQRKLLNAAIQETDRDKIFHVGFSVKKSRLPDYMSQNNIADKNYKIVRRRSFFNQKKILQKSTLNADNLDDFNIRKETEMLLNSKAATRVPTGRSKTTTRRHIAFPLTQHIDPIIESAHNHQQPQSFRYQGHYQTQTQEYQQQPLITEVFTQAYVRRTLHPSLDDEYLGSTECWIPGQLQKSETERKQRKQNKDKCRLSIRRSTENMGMR